MSGQEIWDGLPYQSAQVPTSQPASKRWIVSFYSSWQIAKQWYEVTPGLDSLNHFFIHFPLHEQPPVHIIQTSYLHETKHSSLTYLRSNLAQKLFMTTKLSVYFSLFLVDFLRKKLICPWLSAKYLHLAILTINNCLQDLLILLGC